MNGDILLTHGDTITLFNDFVASNDTALRAEVFACFQELGVFSQPLSGNMVIGCQEIQSGYFEPTITPPFPAWHIRASILPAHVALRHPPENCHCTEALQLSADILNNWVSQALEQKCSSLATTHKVAWKFIEFTAIQAKLPNAKNFLNQKLLWLGWKSNRLSVPVEKIGDELWVSGPIFEPESRRIKAPFYIILSQEYGRIELSMQIYWSLWTHPNSAGYPIIYEMIKHFLQRNWKASCLPAAFEADFY